MNGEKEPPRNFFDEVAGWLGGNQPERGGGGPQRWLGQLFALLGTTFAVLQLLFSTLDLANRAVSTVLTWLPYLVPLTFLAGAVVSIYLIRSPGPARQRRLATGALALILVAGSGWGGWSYYEATRPPRSVIVLVADFERQEATKGVDWGRRIYDRVKDQVARLKLDERVDVVRVFEAYGSSEEARERGAGRKATIVLWGWYDDVGVSPHFELLQRAQAIQTNLSAPPQDLMDFDLYVRSGPQDMAYIVSVVLGMIHYAEHDYVAAESLFTTALSAAPDTSALLGLEIPYLYRANARLFMRQPMDAVVTDLQQAVSYRPELWQGHWNLAVVYTDYCAPALALDDALVEAELVGQLRPEDPQAYWLRGQIHSEREEWDSAAAAYRQALALDPQHVEAHEGLARSLEALGRQEEAQVEHTRALAIRREKAADLPQQSPDRAEAQDRLGYAYLNAGQYDQAIAAFQEALRLKPDQADYHRHLGNAYYWQGKASQTAPSSRLAQAIAEYETARALAPLDSLLLTVLGGAYAEAGRTEDALRAYQDAVDAEPCDAAALFLLASLYEQMDRRAEAEDAFRRLVLLDPGHAVGWQALAVYALNREDYQAAAQAYRAAVTADPGSADLYFGLASTLYQLGDYAGAAEAYARAGELAPGDAPSLAGWADTQVKLERTNEAITAYERVVQLDAQNALYRLILAGLYEQTGQWDKALDAYTRSSELQPEQALAHAGRGRILQRLEKTEEALAAYQQAVRYDTAEAYYWESLALNYATLSRLDEALDAADETLARQPENAVAHMVRAGVFEERGEREQARTEYRRVLELAGGNQAVADLARAALAHLEE